MAVSFSRRTVLFIVSWIVCRIPRRLRNTDLQIFIFRVIHRLLYAWYSVHTGCMKVYS